MFDLSAIVILITVNRHKNQVINFNLVGTVMTIIIKC